MRRLALAAALVAAVSGCAGAAGEGGGRDAAAPDAPRGTADAVAVPDARLDSGAETPEDAPAPADRAAPADLPSPADRSAPPDAPADAPADLGAPPDAAADAGADLAVSVDASADGPRPRDLAPDTPPPDAAAGCDPEASPTNPQVTPPAGLGGCPAGMAPLPGGAACIDRWEAHLIEDTADGPRPWSPYRNPGDRTVIAVSAPGVVPQGYIDEVQAAAACDRAGRRLCTRAEWELTCGGPEGRAYPYGDVRRPGVCNDARAVHPAIEWFGTSDAWIWSELTHPCLNQLPDSLAATGAHEGCVTPESVFDLMGNLHEWVDDPGGTFKGGFYVDTVLNGEGCRYTTTAHNVWHWDYSTGFRCCADP